MVFKKVGRFRNDSTQHLAGFVQEMGVILLSSVEGKDRDVSRVRQVCALLSFRLIRTDSTVSTTTPSFGTFWPTSKTSSILASH